jgi:nicotinamide phosphoribosyltransferase
MKHNPLTAIDFYKADHKSQYPEGTEVVYSNFTPRSDKLSNIGEAAEGKVVFFGLQGFIKWFLQDLWNDEFFNKPKEDVVRKYKRRMDNSLGKDAVDVSHIADLHDLGYLPLHIKALPEGAKVPMQVPVLTVFNTHKDFFWLVNYLESIMSTELWKSCTTATTAAAYRTLLDAAAVKTGAPLESVQFQGHDFSLRGNSGLADSASSGMGHLLSFVGTDSVPAIDYAEDYYNADSDIELVGCSVFATEHSVMCMGGMDDEIGTFRRLITDIYPTGIISIVSDTWDFWRVITEYLPQLKSEIMARKADAVGMKKVVIRPDSGDPVKIICGYKVLDINCKIDKYNADSIAERCGASGFEAVREANGLIQLVQEHETVGFVFCGNYITEAEVKGAVECLYETFGGPLTSKGYKMLDEHIGLIYGDSITLDRARQIMERLEQKGFASSNVVLGIGSYTYQYVTRDTYGFAMKATWGLVNGEGREIFKAPKTDSGVKKSAKGLLRVELEDGEYVLYDQQTKEQEGQGELKTVFHNSISTKGLTLQDIRDRLRGYPSKLKG